MRLNDVYDSLFEALKAAIAKLAVAWRKLPCRAFEMGPKN